MTKQPATILVAEDDRALRDLMVLALERLCSPSRVITAEDGPCALALADKHRPQLVLVDVLLPQLNGLEVIRRLRAQGQTAPAIALSALGFREVVQQAIAAGARDFVVKPFDLNLLAGKVQRLLLAQP